MRDLEVRVALVQHVLAPHLNDQTLLRHELGICAGRRRADVALVNGELSGWEIKSDHDSFARLGGQIEAYSAVFDRATIVTTSKWLEAARNTVPEWWGITLVRDCSGVVTVRRVRRARDNSRRVQPFELVQLLWRDEALDELRRRDAAQGLSGRARHYVWERLATSVPLTELREVVRERLKARRGWPTGSSQAPGGGSSQMRAIL